MLATFYFLVGLVLLVILSFRIWVGQRREHRRDQIIANRLAGYLEPGKFDELAIPYWDRVVIPSFRHYRSVIAKRVTPTNVLEELSNKLRLAGSKQSPEVFFFSRIAFSLVALLASGIIALSIHLPNRAFAVLVPVIVAAVVFLFPGIRLNTRAEKRRAEIERELPEVFDLLSVSVEAGLAFDGALRKVVSNTEGPVREEFSRVLADMQVGIPRVQALLALAERTHSDQLRRFAGLVAQSDRTGAGISNALRIQARDIKDYRANRAKEKAASIPIKIIFPMVIFIFPAVFIVILGPAVVSVVKLFFH